MSKRRAQKALIQKPLSIAVSAAFLIITTQGVALAQVAPVTSNGGSTNNSVSLTGVSYSAPNSTTVAGQVPVNNVSLGPFSNIPTTTNPTNTTTAGGTQPGVNPPVYGQVDSNSVINSGLVTTNGISFSASGAATASANGSAYFTSNSTTNGSTAATSSAYSQSDVTTNSVKNSGIVTGATGIGFSSSATSSATATANTYIWANNDGSVSGEYPNNTSTNATTTSVATANANSNSVLNSGVINATSYGVQIKSNSAASDSTSVSSDAYYGLGGQTIGLTHSWGSGVNNLAAVSNTSSNSFVNSNLVTNSGSVVVSNGGGVVLNAVATTTSSSSGTTWNGSAYVATGENTSANSATSNVNTNTIGNTGTIAAGYTSSTNLSDGIGLYAVANIVNNNGLVSGAESAVVNGNIIGNSGLIYAMNDGISLTANAATITGTGTRTAQVTNNTITNAYSGRIVANSTGINLAATTVSGNVIKNSGLIVADPGMSLIGTSLTRSNAAAFNTAVTGTAINIAGAGAGNTVNLNAPAYLAGQLLFTTAPTNSNTTVNLTSGMSQSNLWSIRTSDGYAASHVNLSGPLPWFVNTTNATGSNGVRNNMYATIDPTALTAAPNMLAELSGMVNEMITGNMSKDLKASDHVWVAGQSGAMTYGGNNYTTMGQNTNLNGVAIGYDTTVASDYRVGIMGGINNAMLNTGSMYGDVYANSFSNKANGGFLSIHGSTKVGIFALDAGLSGGMQNNTSTRFVNDNLQYWGISYAHGSYNSQWISPVAKVGLPIGVGDGFEISPNVQVSYSAQNTGTYTETGSSSNATYASQTFGIIESRAAVDLTKDLGQLKATLTAGYLNRSLSGSNSVSVNMIGDTHTIQGFYNNLNAGFVKLNARIDTSEHTELNVGGSYISGSNGTSGSFGNVALKYKF